MKKMRSFVFTFIAACVVGTAPAFADHANDETHEGDETAQESGLYQEQEQDQTQVQVQDQEQFQAQGQIIEGNFSGNTTVVNPNLDVDSSDFRKHAESAPRVEGSESGCHSGASGQSGTFGGSLGGASASCDALNGLRAIHAADAMGEVWIRRMVRANVIVRSGARLVLSVCTFGLL